MVRNKNDFVHFTRMEDDAEDGAIKHTNNLVLEVFIYFFSV